MSETITEFDLVEILIRSSNSFKKPCDFTFLVILIDFDQILKDIGFFFHLTKIFQKYFSEI